MHFPYVKAAILSTYKDEPCGYCQVISLIQSESDLTFKIVNKLLNIITFVDKITQLLKSINLLDIFKNKIRKELLKTNKTFYFVDSFKKILLKQEELMFIMNPKRPQ